MQSHLVARGSSLSADIADYRPMVIVVDAPKIGLGDSVEKVESSEEWSSLLPPIILFDSSKRSGKEPMCGAVCPRVET